MLEKYLHLVEELEATSSSTKKKEILQKHLGNSLDSTLVPFLWAIYNQFQQYHLTHETAMKKGNKIYLGAFDSHLFTLLEGLCLRNITGQNACDTWKSFVLALPVEQQDLAGRILDKDLKCRLGLKTVNKVLKEVGEDLIPFHEVSLGKQWKGEAVWEKGRYYASRKLDGIRCNATLQRRTPLFFSRQGKPFITLGILERELKSYIGSKIILDGELALRTPDGSDDFQGLMKQIRRKDHQIPNICYHVFDVIFLENSSESFRDRQTRLREIIKKFKWQNVVPVKQILVKDGDHFKRLLEGAEKRGWEGLILRKDAPYKAGRSSDILKVKKMQDREYEVIGIETGKMNIVKDGREKTVRVMKRAVIVHKGCEIGVGSGWSVAQRRIFFRNPNRIIGKIITVQYFEETKNQEGGFGLRFPVVKGIHGKERRT